MDWRYSKSVDWCSHWANPTSNSSSHGGVSSRASVIPLTLIPLNSNPHGDNQSAGHWTLTVSTLCFLHSFSSLFLLTVIMGVKGPVSLSFFYTLARNMPGRRIDVTDTIRGASLWNKITRSYEWIDRRICDFRRFIVGHRSALLCWVCLGKCMQVRKFVHSFQYATLHSIMGSQVSKIMLSRKLKFHLFCFTRSQTSAFGFLLRLWNCSFAFNPYTILGLIRPEAAFFL